MTLRDQWQEHLALGATLLVALMTVTSLLAASGWHVPTALAILASVDPAKLVFGAVVAVGPLVYALVVTTMICTYLLQREKLPSPFNALLLSATILLGISAVLYLAYFYLALIIMNVLAVVFFHVRNRDEELRKQYRRSLAVNLLVGTVLPLIVSPAFGFPLQILTFADSRLNRTAYILSVSDESVVVLSQNPPRSVEYILGTDLKSRTVCTSGSNFFFSSRLIDVWQPRADPACS